MTPKDLAAHYLHDLWNDAEHAHKLADCAKHDFEHGDYAGVLDSLRIADRPVGLLEMRLRDAVKAVSALPVVPECGFCGSRMRTSEGKCVHCQGEPQG